MEVEIGKKTYELKFGLNFINTMDNLYTQNMNGMQFGTGLEMMEMYLGLRRPTALFNVIKAGTNHLNSKPSDNDIEKYLESVFVEGKDEELFKKVEESAEQAPFLKRTMQNLKAQGKQATKHTKK